MVQLPNADRRIRERPDVTGNRLQSWAAPRRAFSGYGKTLFSRDLARPARSRDRYQPSIGRAAQRRARGTAERVAQKNAMDGAEAEARAAVILDHLPPVTGESPLAWR
jgi:hypothetical protein